MIAAAFLTNCAVVAAMTLAAHNFGQRVKAPKIPMQWGFDGEPTWYASKVVSLWTPVGLAIVGGPLFLLAIGTPPRAEHAAFGLIVFSAVMAIIYSVYLAAILRWASKQPS